MQNAQSKVLEGVKVVDLTTHGAGPCTTRILGDWGADVIKVETFAGDQVRYTDANMGIPFDENLCGPHHDLYNANKRGIVLNLKTDEGKEVMARLLEKADVFMSNSRLKALTKFGLDYETVSKKYPHIIWAHLSGYGTEGPDANDPGYDTVAYWARGGKLADFCEKDTAPLVPPIAVGDLATGATLAGGIAAALYQQAKTGKGDKVEISLYGSSIWNMGSMLLGLQYNKDLQFPKSRKDMSPLVTTYPCSDGNWVSLTMFEWERFFPIVAKMLGIEEYVNDPRFADVDTAYENRDIIIPIMEKKFKTMHTAAEWDEIMKENDLPHSVLKHMKDVLTDEQAFANNYLYRVTTRTLGDCYLPAAPVQIGGNFAPRFTNAPLLGEHTEEVMKECGYSDAQIAEYAAKGAVKCWGK